MGISNIPASALQGARSGYFFHGRRKGILIQYGIGGTMGTFIGGSAYAMAKEIMEGYILLSPTYLKKYTTAEIMALQLELEKFQREARAEQLSLDDIEALKRKNRKIQRTSSALMTVKNFLQAKR